MAVDVHAPVRETPAATALEVQHFFDPRTSALTYVVHDPATKIGAIVDPVADYDHCSGRYWLESAERVAAYVYTRALRVPYVLDTHTHADHLTALPFFKKRYGAKTAIGSGIVLTQRTFRHLFNMGGDFATDGSQFDVLLDDRETLDVGPFTIETIFTPGHTAACTSYRIGDLLFCGDTFFMPDYGTGRCDFPGGSAGKLYDSLQRLLDLPAATRTLTGHDYQPGGRELQWESTIGAQRDNVHLREGDTRDKFIAMKTRLDAEKQKPTLMWQAIQVNIRGGALPEPEDNGLAYLKIPVNAA